MILKAVTKRLGWGGWTVTFGDVRAFWRMCAEWEAFSISGRSGSNDMSRLRGLRAAVLCSELAPVPVLTGPPLPCVLGLLSWKDSLSERVTAVWMVPSRSTSTRPTAPLLPVRKAFQRTIPGASPLPLWDYLQSRPQSFPFWTPPPLGTQFSSRLPH